MKAEMEIVTEEPIVYRPASDPETVDQGLKEGWIQPAQKPVEMKVLKLSEITRDRKFQKRFRGTNNGVVSHYRVLLEEGYRLAPPKVMLVDDKYLLYDGWHTYSATFQAGIEELECEVTVGTLEEAEWAACASNRDHGLQRSNDDIREACLAAIRLHPNLSNNAIAKHVGCDKNTVKHWREHLNGLQPGEFTGVHKAGASPGGHTLEELVELYQPLGNFKATGDRKFRYELEMATNSHFFRGLDEAFGEFPRLSSLYQRQVSIDGNGANRAAKAVTGVVPFSYTPKPDSSASQPDSDGNQETRAQRYLKREIPGCERSLWGELSIGEMREEILDWFQFASFERYAEDADWSQHRGWEYRADGKALVMDVAFGDRAWSLAYTDAEIAPYSAEGYCRAVIDWVEWAIPNVLGQMEMLLDSAAPPSEPSASLGAEAPKKHPAGIIASADSPEHYTPEPIWRAGLECFGVDEFDLDPASYQGSPIPCKQIYTREDDGLSFEWEADTLWSNFPYSDIGPDGKRVYGVMNRFVTRLIDAYDSGQVKQALTLVKSDCRPEWFHDLLDAATAFCMIRKALKFGRPDDADKENGGSFFGSIVFYLGPDVDRFYHAYSPLGAVCQAIEPGMFGE